MIYFCISLFVGFQTQEPNYGAGSESFVRTDYNEDLCLKVRLRFKELNLNLNPYKWWKQGCVYYFHTISFFLNEQLRVRKGENQNR